MKSPKMSSKMSDIEDAKSGPKPPGPPRRTRRRRRRWPNDRRPRASAGPSGPRRLRSISLNFCSASLSPGLRSGWNSIASLRNADFKSASSAPRFNAENFVVVTFGHGPDLRSRCDGCVPVRPRRRHSHAIMAAPRKRRRASPSRECGGRLRGMTWPSVVIASVVPRHAELSRDFFLSSFTSSKSASTTLSSPCLVTGRRRRVGAGPPAAPSPPVAAVHRFTDLHRSLSESVGLGLDRLGVVALHGFVQCGHGCLDRRLVGGGDLVAQDP